MLLLIFLKITISDFCRYIDITGVIKLCRYNKQKVRSLIHFGIIFILLTKTLKERCIGSKDFNLTSNQKIGQVFITKNSPQVQLASLRLQRVTVRLYKNAYEAHDCIFIRDDIIRKKENNWNRNQRKKWRTSQ